MRARIALVAAVVASIVISAAAAGAVVITSSPPAAGTRHTLRRHVGSAPRARSEAVGQSPLELPELMRSIERKVAWQRYSSPGASSELDARAGRTPSASAAPKPPAPAGTTQVQSAPAEPASRQLASSEPQPSDATSTTTSDWACIRDHESGDDYGDDTGNGYSGAYQFMPSTWNEAVSGAGYPQYGDGEAYAAPPAVQNAAALWLYDHDGWAPWSTRYACGL